MSSALSAGVTGLQAHQKMLDIAGNNLANVNTTAFKASRITFSELLSETVKKASQPTSAIGGTNPQQLGSGVGISGITPNMTQGSIVNTGNPLDLAIEGEGYFVLSSGSQNIYTRAGAFSVDANSNLVDPSTGYVVQRIGSIGESDGFQIPGNSNIKVPYDVAMPASATTLVRLAGNLSSDASLDTPQTNVLKSNIALRTVSGELAASSTLFSQLSSGTFESAAITVSGYAHDGTALTPATISIADDGSTTIGDFLSDLNAVLGADNAVASLQNGRIVITDAQSGYSRSDIKLEFSNSGTADIEMPAYFETAVVGGSEVKNINITVYDSQGGAHVLSGALVRTNTDNTWDMILTSVTGDISSIAMQDRRINGIRFNAADGAFAGLAESSVPQFTITFAHDPSNPQTIEIGLGTEGRLDGLTQYSGNSTAVAREQNGYPAGRLTTVSVNNEGILIGAFSNGIKKNIAAIQVALFQNPAGLEALGNGYYIPSANSGEAVATQAMNGGAGSIHGGALEKSNTDVASEFVNLIQAQNGYQANARTIKVANDILSELTNLIR
ncbi:MAG TPA: flagellar hook-basal body complex protein [Anaerohalosphaeraceae bacterium]|nr:flagellar hook-basal body complex protein [Phycisphaerae bacterium]HOK95029.1 flagellar hook-basal body complex protein [Anaerohalosphaeraceae bacterium]HOL30340.1 flagellar hook-basal body complex protein [Anaerohalosphaeraceae bacterium]HOM75402.1 flagellar hook-basal body complex protein [Anaerohalosphaeraceae bacterium]HPC63038.1 flagellar hook-basal body complex protein [Anaerohalosphaeraceae bacterium]